MSKITPKNLHYDNSLPPFLARLQANNASQDGRHEYHVARPKRARNAEEEAEDEPVYFDEGTGETLTKTEWEAKEAEDVEKGDGESTANKEGVKPEGGKELKESKEKLAAMQSYKKRKAGKVVGKEDDEEVTPETEKKSAPKADGKKAEKGKSTKKGKKIKLSFGDDE
jgi:hypothetical protein